MVYMIVGHDLTSSVVVAQEMRELGSTNMIIIMMASAMVTIALCQ
jgi:hypothetical protein